MITLYGYPNTRSFRVLWALEELNIEYQYQLTHPLPDMQDASFIQLNPSRKIPVIKHDNLVVSESAAILNYLADHFGTYPFIPTAGTGKRATYDQWCYFMLSELEQPLWTIAKHRFILPEALRHPPVKDSVLWEFEQMTACLATQLENNPFVTGEHFTPADILCTSTLMWAKMEKAPLTHDIFSTYLNKMMQMPAFQKANEIEAAQQLES